MEEPPDNSVEELFFAASSAQALGTAGGSPAALRIDLLRTGHEGRVRVARFTTEGGQ